MAMWTVITSDGQRVVDMPSEMDARRAVHSLGVTQLRGPYSWDVIDNHGRSFVAEIRRVSGGGPSCPPVDPRERSADLGRDFMEMKKWNSP
jgi:hypothetical protein